MKKVTVLLIAFALMTVFHPNAFSSQSLDDKMMSVSPGMKKADVLITLGEPSVILSKSLNRQGRFVEVWQYDTVRNDVSPIEGAFRSIAFWRDSSVELDRQKALARQRVANPPYIITIQDGVVRNIGRAKNIMGNVMYKITDVFHFLLQPDILGPILGCTLIVLALFLYFLPTVIACNKRLRKAGVIFWLNLFLGGTGVGWIILLIWVCADDR